MFFPWSSSFEAGSHATDLGIQRFASHQESSSQRRPTPNSHGVKQCASSVFTSMTPNSGNFPNLINTVSNVSLLALAAILYEDFFRQQMISRSRLFITWLLSVLLQIQRPWLDYCGKIIISPRLQSYNLHVALQTLLSQALETVLIELFY